METCGSVSGARLKVGRASAVAAVAALVLLWTWGPAAALTIPVYTDDGSTQIGVIDVDVSADGAGVVGGFKSTVGGPPPTLAAAAAANGEDHFNWLQIVVEDNNPPPGQTPPYIDPPPGGYPGQWADNLPWYWDEGPPPLPGEPGYEEWLNREWGYDLEDNLLDMDEDGLADTLFFEDFPWDDPGTNLKFNTWLVSLNADGSLHSYHEGFEWTWSRPASGGGSGGGSGRNIFSPGYVDQIVMVSGPLAPLPEPSSFLLLLCGSLGLLLRGRPRRR